MAKPAETELPYPPEGWKPLAELAQAHPDTATLLRDFIEEYRDAVLARSDMSADAQDAFSLYASRMDAYALTTNEMTLNGQALANKDMDEAAELETVPYQTQVAELQGADAAARDLARGELAEALEAARALRLELTENAEDGGTMDLHVTQASKLLREVMGGMDRLGADAMADMDMDALLEAISVAPRWETENRVQPAASRE